ncbi:MAG: hypothetical protein GX061_05540 [Eubacteriaceae bacterium]|nr:hypothetical protein [Eubacteriaceae bacterium]
MSEKIKATPAVRRFARENNVPLEELTPSEKDNRVTQADIMAYLAAKKSVKAAFAQMEMETAQYFKAAKEQTALEHTALEQTAKEPKAQEQSAYEQEALKQTALELSKEAPVIGKYEPLSAREEGAEPPERDEEETLSPPYHIEGEKPARNMIYATDQLSPEAEDDDTLSLPYKFEAPSDEEGEVRSGSLNLMGEVERAKRVIRKKNSEELPAPSNEDYERIAQDAVSSDEGDLLSSLYDGYIAERAEEPGEDKYEYILDEQQELAPPSEKVDYYEEEYTDYSDKIGRISFEAEKLSFEALSQVAGKNSAHRMVNALAKALALAFKGSGEFPAGVDVVIPEGGIFEKHTLPTPIETPLASMRYEPSEEHPEVIAELWDVREFTMGMAESFGKGKMRFFVNEDAKRLLINGIFDETAVSLLDALTVAQAFKSILCDPLPHAESFLGNNFNGYGL